MNTVCNTVGSVHSYCDISTRKPIHGAGVQVVYSACICLSI